MPRLAFYMPGLAMGGAERVTIDLRHRLSALGYPTSLIAHGSTVSPAIRRMPGAEDAQVLGLGGMTDLAAWPSAYSAIKSADADIIFIVNPSQAIWAVILRAFRATRAKIVLIFHATDLRPEGEVRLPLFILGARFVDVMVFVSRNQMAYWLGRKMRSRRDITIVNGVDLQRFKNAPETNAQAKLKLGITPDAFVAGLLATFRPEKNHIELVEAAARMRDAGTPITVLFVGDGATRPLVQARVEELKLEDSVIFSGEFDDVGPIIAAFDVGVLCSTEIETFSMAALELLASGVPMVMTNIGGASEIVEPNVNGFLYEKGDTDALVRHLTTLSDATTCAAFRSRARPSVERYSIEAMMEHYVRLIQDLAASRRTSSLQPSAPRHRLDTPLT
ncbi:MAG TPA: glycosyltransferase family 4 protein [Caulobacteraceae bacterium]|jgi:glycosyltransferase involved in cell wall biosynthesis